jgi:tRNA A37 threonylcarbamoyladenosine dehydratase
MNNDPSFNRLQMVTGEAALSRLQQTSVILFGVGGVGSWCAEALVRSGIGRLVIVDSDLVCRTNINRQVQATSTTVGKVKVDELAARLRAINPDAEIVPRQEIYQRGDAGKFALASYDYVLDAIDSLSAKVDLIAEAVEAGATVYTALGASCKLDPTQIKVAPLWKTHGCPLGKLVRKRLRYRKFAGNPLAVYSAELLPLHEGNLSCGGGGACICPKTAPKKEDGEEALVHEWCSSKMQINGSAVHITGTFGFFLAGLVIQDVVKKAAGADSSEGQALPLTPPLSG